MYRLRFLVFCFVLVFFGGATPDYVIFLLAALKKLTFLLKFKHFQVGELAPPATPLNIGESINYIYNCAIPTEIILLLNADSEQSL